ncbi:hypothetical protein ACA910_018022 [Epithemia clementina (nom. ined.)]
MRTSSAAMDGGDSETQAADSSTMIQESRSPLSARCKAGGAADSVRGSCDSRANITQQALAHDGTKQQQEQGGIPPHIEALIHKAHEVALAWVWILAITYMIGLSILLDASVDSFFEAAYFVGLSLSGLTFVEVTRLFQKLYIELEPDQKSFIRGFIPSPRWRWSTCLAEARAFDCTRIRDETIQDLIELFPWCGSFFPRHSPNKYESETQEPEEDKESGIHKQEIFDKESQHLLETATDKEEKSRVGL